MKAPGIRAPGERHDIRFALDDGREVRGWADQGYGDVVDTFVDNFVDRHDLGAAAAVYAGGSPVVDLWGGIADRRSGRPWAEDTAAVIFSCTKGVLAVLAYRLVDQHRLDLDAPIARYWPEFAQAGKEAITVRDAMAHRAGLASLDVDLTRQDALDWAHVVRAIERQAPMHAPHAGHLYHAMTYGWIVGEIIRRVTGRSPGQFLAQELAGPLGLRAWIGLPPSARGSVAWMEVPLPDEDSEGARAAAALVGTSPTLLRSVTMGGAWGFPVEDGTVSFNDPAIQAAEVPGANGIATARSLARLYAACVSTVDGPPILSDAAIRDALVVQCSGPQLSGLPDDGARWGTGFQLSSPPSQPMLGASSFGHAGAGGQLAFADADRQVGFAYLGNQMGGYGDERGRRLTLALRRILGA